MPQQPQSQQQSNPSLFGYGDPPRDPWGSFRSKVVEALQDPRNAMMFGPEMGLIRAPGALRQAMQLIPSMSERGSFLPSFIGQRLANQGGSNIPVAQRIQNNPNPMVQNRLQMTKEGVPFDDQSRQVYAKMHELDVREINQIAEGVTRMDPGFAHRREAWEQRRQNADPITQRAIDQTIAAMQALHETTKKQGFSTMGQFGYRGK